MTTETTTTLETNQTAEVHSDKTSGGASFDNTTTASAGISTGNENASVGIEISAKTGTEASVEGGLDGMEVAGPVGNDAAGMAGNVPGGAPGQI